MAAARGKRSQKHQSFSMGFRSHVRHFRGTILGLLRPSEPWCFAAGSCFFRSLTGIRSSSRRHQSCEQPQATESLDNLSLDNLSRQSTLMLFSRISDDTLGSFFAWLWTFLVLQSHDVLLPGAAFFEAVLPASAAAAAATSSASSRRQQNLSTNAVFLFFCRQSVDISVDKYYFSTFFLEISRRHVWDFFRVVLDLARPSEPWCFAAGSYFFRSCFTGISSSSRRHQFCEQPQATESLDNLSTMCCFRPSEAWCFAPGR